VRRFSTLCLLALSATALLVSAPAAPAAKEKAATPSITRVTPMRISVGATLTIAGRNFKPHRVANTVIFRAPNGRSAFAKPSRVSRRKLVVVVPEGVSRLLSGTLTEPKPTRLKLRVLTGRFSAFTSPRLSPVITPFGT
jgi:IPT/TIG domain